MKNLKFKKKKLIYIAKESELEEVHYNNLLKLRYIVINIIPIMGLIKVQQVSYNLRSVSNHTAIRRNQENLIILLISINNS